MKVWWMYREEKKKEKKKIQRHKHMSAMRHKAEKDPIKENQKYDVVEVQTNSRYRKSKMMNGM